MKVLLQPPHWIAGGCSLAALVLYSGCLAPTVTVAGDCGELIAASFLGGVAHPSGYALYCVLARVFALLIPFGEVALRYNLFSALCSAATVGMVAFLVARLTQPRAGEYSVAALLPAPGAGLLLAGMVFFGAQAVIAEVYALNALLIALIFGCGLAVHQQPDNYRKVLWLAGLALLGGLSLNSHLSIVFVWPGILLWLWPHLVAARALVWRKSIALVFAFLIGFSFTLSLPLNARAFPEPATERIAGNEYSWFEPLDWGHPVDFERWKTHVTVGQYGSLLLRPKAISVAGKSFVIKAPSQTPAQAARRFLQFCGYISLQFLWATPLILVGAAAFRNSNAPRLGAALLLIFALNVLVAVHYDVDNVFDIANFLFPAYIVIALWMGLGIHALFSTLRHRPRVLALCRILLLAAVFCQWFLFVQSASFRGNTRARDLAIERAEAATHLQTQTGKTPSLLLLTDDTLFPFWYVQKVLGHAPDAQTPWGLPLRKHIELNQLPELAARFQQRGPVAVAQWNENLDRRFPYVPLNQNGSLWQLSQRALPYPAMPSTRAREFAGFHAQPIRRVEARAFEIAFRAPEFVAQKPLAVDERNQTQHVGWIEVLAAPRGLLQNPSPAAPSTPPVWRQARRLIVRQDARPGVMLQAILALQFPIDARPGAYELWTRAVRSRQDRSTPWRRAGQMRIEVK